MSLFLNFQSFSQVTITNPTQPDIAFPIPIIPNGLTAYNIRTDMNDNAGTQIVATIIEHQTALGMNELVLTLYDGAAWNSIPITPSTIIMGQDLNSNTYPQLTNLSNPDIVLLNGGTKAIITFEDGLNTCGAYFAEFDINLATLTVAQSLFGYGGAVAVTRNFASNTFSKAARIDRTVDFNGFDIVGLVSVQDVNGIDMPMVSYLQDLIGFFGFASAPINNYVSAFPNAISDYSNPDIAVGHDIINGVTNCVVVAVSGVGTTNYSVDVNEINSITNTATARSTSPGISTVILGSNLIRPRICAEPTYDISNNFNLLPYSITFTTTFISSPFFSTSNLYYAQYNGTLFESFLDPDPCYVGEPAIEFMKTPLSADREACAVWPAAFPTSAGYEIYSVMNPIINNTFYNWNRVNTTPIGNTSGLKGSVDIAGCWDNGTDQYVITWVHNATLFMKIRAMHTTNYKVDISNKPFSYTLYPNPATDKVTMDVPNNIPYTVLDAIGNKVASGITAYIGQSSLNVSHLPSGTYFISIENKPLQFNINK